MAEVKFSDVRNSPKNRISEPRKYNNFLGPKIPFGIFWHPENQTQKKIDFLEWQN